MVQGRKNIEVAALVEFCVWQRNVAHAEMSALVLCRGEFESRDDHSSGRLLHTVPHREFVNAIPCWLFNPLQKTHHTKQCHDRRELREIHLPCFTLGELSSAIRMKEISKPTTGLLFSVTAIDPNLTTSDKVALKLCIWFCTQKQISGCEQVIVLLLGCEHSRDKLHHPSSEFQS